MYLSTLNEKNIKIFLTIIAFALIFGIIKLIVCIIGTKYSSEITGIPYKERIKKNRITEYIVIIISIINIIIGQYSSLKTFIIFNKTHSLLLITMTKLIPLILYLIINKKNETAKGVTFLILSLSLIFI